MTEWEYDDPSIDDAEILYRRVPKVPDCRTKDPLTGVYRLNPGGLRRDPDEGMSTHLESVLLARKRDPLTLYDGSTCGSVKFEAEVPRRVGAGVLATEAENEIDEDRAAAHAEVRPPQRAKDRSFWKGVVNEIADAAQWVQPAD